VPRKTFFTVWLLLLSLSMIAVPFDADANRRNDNETPPPQIYKERAIALLDRLSNEQVVEQISPFTRSEQEELKEILREKDKFLYDQPEQLKITNETIHISLREREIVKVRLGHTYTTTIVFTDAMGNPWTVDTLTDMSDTDVVTWLKPAPHILSVRPQKKSGQTNLPVKLRGEQYPITLYFDINEDEVYFNVDVRVDSLGDHRDSQRQMSLSQYQGGKQVPPKLTEEPAKELMLQFLTPEGYAPRQLVNEYNENVDPRDFMAWSKGGKLFIMTPHNHYTPDPTDISAASDGRHKLFEFSEKPVMLMRKNSQVIMLHVK
jgi:hypothetical protein